MKIRNDHIIVIFIISIFLTSCSGAKNIYYSDDSKIEYERIENHYGLKFNSQIEIDAFVQINTIEKILSVNPLGDAYKDNAILVVQKKPNYSEAVFIEAFDNIDNINVIPNVISYPATNELGFAMNEINIKFKPSTSETEINDILNEMGLTKIGSSEYNPKLIQVASNQDVFEEARVLHENDKVERANPNFIIPVTVNSSGLTPSPINIMEPRVWYHDKLKTIEAWTFADTKGNPNVKIAIIDDAIDTNHDDLKQNVVASYNIFRGLSTATPTGNQYHGTQVAGLAVADDNGIGIVGTCPDCSLIAVGGLSHNYDDWDLARLILDRLLLNGNASIISISWSIDMNQGTSIDSKEAIADFILNGRNGKGGLVFHAIKNNNGVCHANSYSSIYGVFAIGGSTPADTYDGYGEGPCVDFVAPSDNLMTTIYSPNTLVSGYDSSFGGTSAATPLVAGIAGLILSKNPSLKRKEVVRILQMSADKIGSSSAYNACGKSDKFGYGRINALNALKENIDIHFTKSLKKGDCMDMTISSNSLEGIKSIKWNCPQIEHDSNNQLILIPGLKHNHEHKFEKIKFTESGNFNISVQLTNYENINNPQTILIPVSVVN